MQTASGLGTPAPSTPAIRRFRGRIFSQRGRQDTAGGATTVSIMRLCEKLRLFASRQHPRPGRCGVGRAARRRGVMCAAHSHSARRDSSSCPPDLAGPGHTGRRGVARGAGRRSAPMLKATARLSQSNHESSRTASRSSHSYRWLLSP